MISGPRNSPRDHKYLYHPIFMLETSTRTIINGEVERMKQVIEEQAHAIASDLKAQGRAREGQLAAASLLQAAASAARLIQQAASNADSALNNQPHALSR